MKNDSTDEIDFKKDYKKISEIQPPPDNEDFLSSPQLCYLSQQEYKR